MAAFTTSFLSVGLAELGDKTQLLTILLVIRTKKVIPVITGIFIATLITQLLASIIGFTAATFLTGPVIHYAIAFSFILGGVLCLIPEKNDDHEIHNKKWQGNIAIIIGSGLTFFIAELGDKTQLITAALAARYHNIIVIALGSMLGMMAVNIPAAFIGKKFSHLIPITLAKYSAAIVFILLGVFTLFPNII